ncbi:MAG: peptidoglycan DD-metalloendopeptidase family protein [Ignavibacteriae bacterium]|nr:peptidoglycan DD-metalloendopeptidase family protein [Ignavibacteriota bacterium]
MRKKLTLVLFFTLASLFSLASMQDEEIKKKQSQLQQLRKEIDRYETKIKEKEKKERATLELLDTYDRQTTLLRKLIDQLQRDEQSLRWNIEETRNSINELKNRVTLLKGQYARYITTAYKHGHSYDLELLLSSKSLNQLLIRSEYLKRFSDQRKRDLDRMNTQRTDLEEHNARLEQQLTEQQKLITEKTKEESRLAAKMKKRKTLLSEIQRDKKNYKREMSRKLDAAKELEKFIIKLIVEDRVRKEKLEREGKASANSREAISSFAMKRGSLRWPVRHGKVLARFGNHQHPVLGTVTPNTGIDIAVPIGTRVDAVAEGEVSAISWLPSFGNLIIVNHNAGFRTVYANLSEISVTEGQKLKEGENIGKSGEAFSGPSLHFEIWKEREKQDPEEWLRPNGLTQR